MKTLILLLAIILVSCGQPAEEKYQDSYGLTEVKTFVTTKQMFQTKDSISFHCLDSNRYVKLPIVITKDSVPFYPDESFGSGIRYYKVKF